MKSKPFPHYWLFLKSFSIWPEPVRWKFNWKGIDANCTLNPDGSRGWCQEVSNGGIFRYQCLVVLDWTELCWKVFYIFCPQFASQSWMTKKIRTITEYFAVQYLHPLKTTTECKLHPFDAESKNKHPKARIILACGHACRQPGKPTCSYILSLAMQLVLCSVVSLQSQQRAGDHKIYITQCTTEQMWKLNTDVCLPAVKLVLVWSLSALHVCLSSFRHTVPFGMSSYQGSLRLRRAAETERVRIGVETQRCVCALHSDMDCSSFCKNR